MAPFTTFRVGGPADWLVTLRGADDVREVVRLAREHGVPVSVLGGGSNLLVADEGVRGLVIRVHGGEVASVDSATLRADAGVTINGLVRWTINRGVAGPRGVGRHTRDRSAARSTATRISRAG